MVRSSRFDLADLLTGIGAAMGASNGRLRESGAPSLLREFTMEVSFQAGVRVPAGEATVLLTRVARPDVQGQVLFRDGRSNVRIEATYIAAPSLVPAVATRGVSDP